MSKQGQEQFEFQRPLVPVTPFRPILPKPPVIHAGGQGNQKFQAANCMGPERCSSGLTQESQTDRVVACSDSTSRAEVNGVNNMKAALDGNNCISGDSNRQRQCPLNLTGLSNVSFADLLALANAASTVSMGAASEGINRHQGECSSDWFLPAHVNLSVQQNIWIDSNCTPRKHQNVIPPQNPNDLNLPSGTMDAISPKCISDFAPITPDKATRAERKEVAEIENLCVENRTTEKRDEQANGLAAADANGLQCSEELQKIVLVSSLTETPTKKNQNPDDGGSSLVDLEKTPEQKQRRRKHRPKVITDGKPRTRKPVTPKPSNSQENPTGKRKYVRKSRVNRDVSVPSGEANAENSSQKRKYVRRKGLNKDSMINTQESEQGTSHPETFAHNKKSCRRALHFDTEGKERGESSASKPACNVNSNSGTENLLKGGSHSMSILQLSGNSEVAAENNQSSIAYELNQSPNQKPKDYISFPEDQAPNTPPPTKNNPPHRRRNIHSQKLDNRNGQDQETARDELKENQQVVLQCDAQLPARSPNDSNDTVMEGRQASELKTNKSTVTQQAHIGAVNSYGVYYNNSCVYQMIPGMRFSNISRRKRNEKGQNSATSSASSSITAAKTLVTAEACLVDNIQVNPHQLSSTGIPAMLEEAGRNFSLNKLQTFDCIMASNLTESLKKKRTRGTTRVRDLASLSGISQCKRQQECCRSQSPIGCGKQEVGSLDRPYTSIESLITDMQAKLTKKKRTRKRTCLINSACSSSSEAQMQEKLLSPNQNQFSAKLLGSTPEVKWKQMFSTDTRVEQLNHLGINREHIPIAYQEQNALVPYNMRYQEQNALVPYNMRYQEQNAIILYRDGTIVPFAPTKKRRPRPKVDLDEETNRVWKLLLENINSEGINGTDEDKAKWWEEERRVFRGRADSFIARMHLVQGDRRFTPWKGSVVDSVVGVFLTQNVSDHLSSSAFMSLAANFPLKSKSKEKSYHQEWTSLVNGANFYVLEPEDTIKWDTETSVQPVGDQSSMIVNGFGHSEEKEVVNSRELSGSSTATVSSINESKCMLLNPSGSSSDTYYDFAFNRSDMETIGSGTECFKGYEETKDVHSSQNSVVSSENSPDFSLAQNAERTGSCSDSNSEGGDLTKGPIFDVLNRSTSFVQLLEMAGSARLHEVCGHQNMPNNENTMVERSQCQNHRRENCDNSEGPESLTGESIIPSANNQPHLTLNSEVREIEHFEMFKEETRSSEASKKKDENTIYGQSTISFDNQRSPQQKMQESNLYTQNSSTNKELDRMNTGSLQSNSMKAKKEKKNDFDWDSLRKQAETNGRERERTEKTMDSLDWEAVRCADVNDIANTIKERGMNNLLAERIKDFLNRLVRDHGSIDLEWLRDVPPDKAKEYLLSIRGLGLKSVECVRLLTLHHLAFPVDTNVGRIAVRLGWVPLQPLPESLQLHLLELYPILESIQKYLWPRLCKLDQRTLYELHYQMITFGKVFCTKGKPNCNACPMRGECRHFASAFASARLALPGLEDKSIVSATENRTSDQTHSVIIDKLPLPLPQITEQSDRDWQSEANQRSQAKTGVNNCDPIIEEPASPEPECTQVAEKDIEDMFYEDPDEIPTIKLNMEEFTQTLQNFMQNNMELQEGDMSKALVALTAEAASIPTPKLKNVRRLRTEHQVYELPDSHPLLKEMDKREPDDPCKYLLAIWTPGETANSIQLPQRRCNSQDQGNLCDEKTCFSCNNIREAESQIVRGTLLIPCRTAMRGSFPLNGTYFQVNEVFADHDSSLNPIDVPREWLWNLPRRMVYFGTSIPSIFKGLTTEEIQHCFWRGYVCVRGFEQKTRAPRPLMARLHFPASKLRRGKDKDAGEDA